MVKWHLYAWDPEGEEPETGKRYGGEMKHFEFGSKESLVEYLNQMAREMEDLPIMMHEFGLSKAGKMRIGDFVRSGFIFINYGEDMDIRLDNKGERVEDIYPAE